MSSRPEAQIGFSRCDDLFVEAIAAVHRREARPVLIGLCGSQGSGKSTMAGRLAARLGEMGHAAAICGLDDFYLTKSERRALAGSVHPLLATRGVPGTHDVALMDETISALMTGKAGVTPVPSFDKAADDRRPRAEWPLVRQPVQIILLEGWCVGAPPQDEAALEAPVNALERREDPDGRWRRWVNARLAGDYASLFARLDLRLMLRAPSFDCVQAWRAEQERGIDRSAPGASRPMNASALSRFIAHYERITRWLLECEPADILVDLSAERVPLAVRRPIGGTRRS